jgi:glyoxylase-like metal-dependent hydrolase (beta-lactamase superfamily II)
MNNNSSHLAKAVSRVSSGALGKSNHETLSASGLTRIDDWHSSMFVVPIDINNPESDYLLFDGGMDTQARELGQFLDSHQKSRARRGIGFKAITAFFSTHPHPDHIGALHVLPTNIPVFVSESDSRVLSGSVHGEGPLPRGLSTLGIKRVALPWLKPEIITHDQEFTFGELSIRAIAMPGHTPGSMAYAVRRGTEDQPSDLVVGDAFDYRRSGRIKNANRVFTADTKQSQRSIVYLSDYLRERNIIGGRGAPAHSRSGELQEVHDYADRHRH